VVRRASLTAVPAAGAGGTEAEAPIARAARAMPLLSCAGVVCAVVGGAVGARDHRVDGPASDWLWLCLFGGACLPTAQVSLVNTSECVNLPLLPVQAVHARTHLDFTSKITRSPSSCILPPPSQPPPTNRHQPPPPPPPPPSPPRAPTNSCPPPSPPPLTTHHSPVPIRPPSAFRCSSLLRLRSSPLPKLRALRCSRWSSLLCWCSFTTERHLDGTRTYLAASTFANSDGASVVNPRTCLRTHNITPWRE
jgi:hypothetical protein